MYQSFCPNCTSWCHQLFGVLSGNMSCLIFNLSSEKHQFTCQSDFISSRSKESSDSPRSRPHEVNRALIPEVFAHSPSSFNGISLTALIGLHGLFSTADTESFHEWMWGGGATGKVVKILPSSWKTKTLFGSAKNKKVQVHYIPRSKCLFFLSCTVFNEVALWLKGSRYVADFVLFEWKVKTICAIVSDTSDGTLYFGKMSSSAQWPLRGFLY